MQNTAQVDELKSPHLCGPRRYGLRGAQIASHHEQHILFSSRLILHYQLIKMTDWNKVSALTTASMLTAADWFLKYGMLPTIVVLGMRYGSEKVPLSKALNPFF